MARHVDDRPARCRGSADYYLDRGAGCEEEPDRQRPVADVDYYRGDESTPGRWLGGGAAAVGLTGALDEAGGEARRNLFDGLGSGGVPLVRPVMRGDPRGLLPARPLVLAVDGAAETAGVDPSSLLGDERLAETYVAAAAAVAADRRNRRRARAAIPADVAGHIAAAAGLDARAMFLAAGGTDGYAEALAHVGDRVDVRRAGWI